MNDRDPGPVTVHLLADIPRHIAAVGHMRWQEWGRPPEPVEEAFWVEVTAREAGRGGLPITWVAVDAAGEALGAVALIAYDIAERRDRSPWLAGMIVRADRRRQGTGRRLVARLEDWARAQGYQRLWVATGPAAPFYQACGWELSERLSLASGEEATVLSRQL